MRITTDFWKKTMQETITVKEYGSWKQVLIVLRQNSEVHDPASVYEME